MELNLRSPRALEASLEASGFRRARRGTGYRQNGLRVTSDHAWLTVEAKAENTAGLFDGQLGKPGLWKTVIAPRTLPTARSSRPFATFRHPPLYLSWSSHDEG